MSLNFCPSCGRSQKPGTAFCTGCGRRFEQPPVHTHTAHGSVVQPSPRDPRVRHTSFIEIEAPKILIRDVYREIETNHRIPLIVLLTVFIAFTAMLLYANIAVTYKKTPIQYRIYKGKHYLSTTSALYIFDESGNKINEITKAGETPLAGMLDFDFAPDGTIYLANTFQKRIEVFAPDGSWQRNFGDGMLSDSFTLKILLDGHILVADTKNHNVKLFYPEGNLLETVGQKGSMAWEFNFPNGLGQFNDGTVLISETNNFRIQRFHPDMRETINPEWSLKPSANPDSGPSEIARIARPINWEYAYWPVRMLVDPGRGRIYVVFIDDFTTPQSFVAVYDNAGNETQQVRLEMPGGRGVNPHNLQLAPDGRVTFADNLTVAAGIWDPETGAVKPTPGADFGSLLEGMRRHSLMLKWFKALGLGGVVFCFAPFLLILAYAHNRLADVKIHNLPIAVQGGDQVRAPKNLAAAILLSLLLPGLGHIYIGETVAGLLHTTVLICLSCPIYGKLAHLYDLGALPWIPIVGMIPLIVVLIVGIIIVYISAVIGVFFKIKKSN